MRYSGEPRDRTYVNGYMGNNLSKIYNQKLTTDVKNLQQM